MANVIFKNVEDTAANLALGKRALLLGFDSTNKRLKYYDASTTEYEGLTLDATGAPTRSLAELTIAGALTMGGDITSSTGVFKYDADNNIEITSTYMFIESNGEKILDYLHSNGYMALNAGAADIDVDIFGTNGTYPVIHVDAGLNYAGINTLAPLGRLDISDTATSATQFISTYSTTAADKAVLVGLHSKSATIGELVATDDNTASLTLQAQIVKDATPDERFIIGEMIFRQNGAATAAGGDIEFWLSNAGAARALNHVMYQDGFFVINEGGLATAGLRVEGDTDSNLICTDPVNNRVGIGTATPESKLNVYVTGLGAVAGNELLNSSFAAHDGNNSRLQIKNYRLSNGANHTTAELRLQKKTDTTDFGYIGFRDGGAIALGGGANTVRLLIDANGNIIINDKGDSIDVRIEGDTDPNLLVTDGSADKVGIGTNAPNAKLHIANIASGEGLIVEGVVGGESNSIHIKDNYNIRSSAVIGNIKFNALKDGTTDTTFADILAYIGTNSAGNYNGAISFRVANASAVMNAVFKMDYNKVTAYQDIYLGTSKTVRDASGNDLLNHGYGEIYVDSGSTAQAITTSTTYTKLTGFTTNGEYDNTAVTADATNDKITIKKTGLYRINGSFSYTSSDNVVWKVALFSGGTEVGKINWSRKISTGADVGSSGFSGLLSVDISGGNVDIDVRARHDAGDGTSKNLTLVYANFNVTEIR